MIDGGDDPIDGSDQYPDLLGRAHFAETVVEALSSVRRRGRSSVLGLVGPWGSGKSSVVNLVLKRLRESEQGWRVGTFTPWLYTDLESLQTGFFDELRATLPDGQQWGLTRQRIAKLALAVGPAANVIGLDASGLIQASAAQWGGLTADATKRSAEVALEKSGLPILMVLDDIDRLTPAELLMVFKLIRVVGRLPNVYYLIAYDEQTVLDLLSNTDLIDHGRSPARARDYLEKIVQVRLDIPPLRFQDGTALLDHELERFLRRHHIDAWPRLLDRFHSTYFEYLVDRLNTPRSIRRYVAQLEALYGRLAAEVDLVDFMLLTWLRIAEPGAYRLVQQHRAELTGALSNPRDAVDLVVDTDARNTLTRWEVRLESAGVAADDVKGVLKVLGELFPRITLALRRASNAVDSSTQQYVHERKGVAHTDFFDRYFAIGVPQDDLADADVDAALDKIAAGAVLTETVRTVLLQDTARVLRKFDVARGRGRFPAIALIRILTDQYPWVADQPGALISNRDAIRSFIEKILPDAIASLDPEDDSVVDDELDRLVEHMRTTDYGLMLLTSAAARSVATGSPPGWFKEHQSLIFDDVGPRLAKMTAPGALGDVLWRAFWAWRMVDQSAASAWIRKQVASGHWQLFDTAVCLFDANGPGPSNDGQIDPRLHRLEEILGTGIVEELTLLVTNEALRYQAPNDISQIQSADSLAAALRAHAARTTSSEG